MTRGSVNHAPPRGREGGAIEQTDAMLRWWSQIGIRRADLAVRRPDGTMIWHRDLPLPKLPLGWARAENVRRAEVYIRPARGAAWPLVFVDDVAPILACRISGRFSSLVVETSRAGGCHLWLACARSLNETQRRQAQRWLAHRLQGDSASVSGEHLGRLAGFKNWKRGGCWVNLLEATHHGTWDAAVLDLFEGSPPVVTPKTDAGSRAGRDTSASAREWGWICGLLESGADPDQVLRRLVEAAQRRRRRDASRYALRTWRKACQHVGAQI